MKRYRLLKDLPTFKAGEEFYLNAKGSLVAANERQIVAYSKQTLEKFPDILIDWFEEIKEGARWRGEVGEIYWWFNDSYGYTTSKTENRDVVDNHRYRLGNYFKTEAEAEKYGEYLESLQIIKDDAKGFKPDWGARYQSKYCGRYNYMTRDIEHYHEFVFKTQGTIYFNSKEDIRESFKKHRKEWLIVLGVEEQCGQ